MAARPDSSSAEARHTYSPRLRTAVVLTGTGTAGAYHAGVLRALHEAGVRIDLVAGRGIGAAGALLAAVDGGAALWDAKGLWKDPAVRRFYRTRAPLRWGVGLLAAAIVVVFLPAVLVVAGALANAVAALMRVVGLELGGSLGAPYATFKAWVGRSEFLLAIVPRIVVALVAAAAGAMTLGVVAAAWRSGVRRREFTLSWTQLAGAPLDASRVIVRVQRGVWAMIRGAAAIRQPRALEVSRSYAELLRESLGQPGCRELIITAHDLDARRDLVFAMLAEPHRRAFFQRRPGPDEDGRHGETIDLAGVGRDHVLDALAGTLCLPVATAPHPMTFAPESYWRGETHRLFDRPSAVVRLLEEVERAGVEQVILASASAGPVGPHALGRWRGGIRRRVGEHLAAMEAAVVRDALTGAAPRFRHVFHIHPAHNPLGALDFSGCYDHRSDRVQDLGELVDRGYEDAYRQFIDPIVGASGETLGMAVPGLAR